MKLGWRDRLRRWWYLPIRLCSIGEHLEAMRSGVRCPWCGT